jgi:hypothetical protein
LELDKVRLFGDLVLAAFFEAEKPNEREAKRARYASAVVDAAFERYRDFLAEWRHAERPLAPFHWEIEFPEVFDRQTPGFDVIVGNPPFAGKNSISKVNVTGYLNWLKQIHVAPGIESSVANADLVAHFFRTAFARLRNEGALGFVATNTVFQGDARRAGLSWISRNGGTLYAAVRRMAWPGRAAVVVCIVHIVRSREWRGARRLGDKVVPHISPLLIPVAMDGEPHSLSENNGKSFKGCEVGSLGFLFQDSDVAAFRSYSRPDGTPLIKEYVGGED